MTRAFAVTPAGLAESFAGLGVPSFRASQILSWIYGQGVVDAAAMTNLPRELRTVLAERIGPTDLAVLRIERSGDGTRKLVFELDDGELIESVLIPDRHRLTLCVSSQVGCAMGCTFCATARLGLKRQLRIDEIVAQVVLARRHLEEDPLGVGHLTNLVFMGMGEPLHNLENLIGALEILTAPWGLGISPRRITVSTVGLVPQMQSLLERTQVNLAVSLSATTEESRRELMPVTRKYSLQAMLDACRALPLPRRKRITFEYVMLDSQNDSEADARRLVGLLHGIRSKVNLICFNPFPDAPFAPAPRPRIERFREILLQSRVHATIRESRGPDIAAACGQLAAEQRRAALA